LLRGALFPHIPRRQKARGGGDSSWDWRFDIPGRYNNPATSELTWTLKPGENVVELNLSN